MTIDDSRHESSPQKVRIGKWVQQVLPLKIYAERQFLRNFEEYDFFQNDFRELAKWKHMSFYLSNWLVNAQKNLHSQFPWTVLHACSILRRGNKSFYSFPIWMPLFVVACLLTHQLGRASGRNNSLKANIYLHFHHLQVLKDDMYRRDS